MGYGSKSLLKQVFREKCLSLFLVLILGVLLLPFEGFARSDDSSDILTAPPKAEDWGVYVRGDEQPSHETQIPMNTDLKTYALIPDKPTYYSIFLGLGIEVNMELKSLITPLAGVITMRLLDEEEKIIREIKIDSTKPLKKSLFYRPAEDGIYYVSIVSNEKTPPGAFLFKVTFRILKVGDFSTDMDSDFESAMLIGVGKNPENHLGGEDVCDRFEFDAFRREIFQVALQFAEPPPPDITVSIVDKEERLLLSEQFANPTKIESPDFRIRSHGPHFLDVCLTKGESKEIYPYDFELKLIETRRPEKSRHPVKTEDLFLHEEIRP